MRHHGPVFLSAGLALTAHAQCDPRWLPGFHPPHLVGQINEMVAFDDGSGPALYLGGDFSATGDAPAADVVRWSGSRFERPGDPTVALAGISVVHAMCVFDDGSGPALYVAGRGTSHPGSLVARWDGIEWTALPGQFRRRIGTFPCIVRDLLVFDDGTGPALYAGGDFDQIDETLVYSFARWDGASWSTPLSGAPPAVYPLGLASIQTPKGPRIAAIAFAAGRLYLLTGGAWEPVPGAPAGTVTSVATFGDPPALHVGFQSSLVARADTNPWTILPPGAPASIASLATLDTGAGPMLYAAGSGSPAVARYDGVGWTSLPSPPGGAARTLAVADVGAGPNLFTGGEGSPTLSALARLDAGQWSPISVSGLGLDGQVHALTRFPRNAPDVSIVIGGSFTAAGGAPAQGLALWNGSTITPLAGGVPGVVHTLAVRDEPSGEALYVGGNFGAPPGGSPNFARWDGSAWSPIGAPFSPVLYSALSSDDARLVIASNAVFGLAEWTGSGWINRVHNLQTPSIRSIVFHDPDGPGPAPETLYVGGLFGSQTDANLARLDGETWTIIHTLPGIVTALASPRDGAAGPGLFIGGTFFQFTGPRRVGRVIDTTILPLNPGFWSAAVSMTTLDTPWGPRLIATGSSLTIDALPARPVALWQDNRWWPVGQAGVDLPVNAALTYHDPALNQTRLIIGGNFNRAGDFLAARIAVAALCPPCPGDANDDRLIDFLDLNAVLANFGASGSARPGDLNADGVVDFLDLNLVLANFGLAC